MPETSVGSDSPPKVDITVKNGPGGGADHIVGLFVAWNPVYVEGSNPQPSAGAKLEKSKGYCVWSGKNVPSGKTEPFSLDFCRNNPGITWVIACTMDPNTGAFSSAFKWEVPEDHPDCASRSGKTTKKVAKKKAGKAKRKA